MATGLEREIKLRFADASTARAAVIGIGATLLRPRRLQHDILLDTSDGLLRSRRSILRVRTEDGDAVLTFKGPVQPGTMKIREEVETIARDAGLLVTILARIGFGVWFRYEKFREEFATRGVIVAVDETPIGTFAEIEGSEEGVTDCARELGRGPDEYILDSYRGLFLLDCESRGVHAGDMLFDRV